jgi:4-diphosphocytidyl-2-C-methyl-D-erythritol kinase
LTTVFQAVSLFDELVVEPAGRLSLELSGEGWRDVPRGEDNLALKAVRVLAEHLGRRPDVHVRLRKSIPVAGGMAGGSADAAAALVACDALWEAGLDRDTLRELGGQLGSDVPFALHGGTALGRGRGEQLHPVLARGRYHWVFAFAEAGLSTATVYGELDRQRSRRDPPHVAVGPPDALLAALRAADADAVGRALANDLEPAALRLRPQLRRVLEAGRDLGAIGGVVSGSGPTVALLAQSEKRAVALAAALAGAGVARSVQSAYGPVGGARVAPMAAS